EFGKASVMWDQLVKQLVNNLDTGGATVKEQYLDCYYHLVLCVYKNGVGQQDEKKRTGMVKQAATLIGNLENKGADWIETIKPRFQELLDKEPALKEQYDALKKPAK